MSKYEQIERAIAERRALGHTDEEIVDEFTAAGYTDEAARSFLQSTSVATSIPPSSEPLAPEAPAATVSSTPGAAESPAIESAVETLPWLRLVGLGVLLLAVLALAALVFLFRQEVTSWVRVQLGGTPYATESELMEGVLTTAQTERRLDFTATAGVEFLPADAIVNPKQSEAVDDTLASLQALGVEIPEEGHARVSVSGTGDWRNEENPAADIALSLDVLVEPFILQLAADARTVDDRNYVRITDLPALFKQSLDGMPLNEWVEVEDGAGVSAPAIPIAPPGIISVPDVPGLAARLAPLQSAGQSILTELQVAGGNVLENAQRAQLSAADAPTALSPQQRSAVRDQVIESPIFTFVGEPEKVSEEDGTYFRYEIDIDYPHLVALIEQIAELAATTGDNDVAADMRELLEQVSAENIATINNLTDMYLHVRPSGSWSGYEVVSGIVPTDSPNGIQFRFVGTWSPAKTGSAITPPAEVYEFTLEEIQEQQRDARREEFNSLLPGAGPTDARMSARDASVQQMLSNLRTQAEIVFNKNGFTYQDMCTDPVINQSFAEIEQIQSSSSVTQEVICRSTDREYVLAAPLPSNSDVLMCADSLGNFTEVSTSLRSDTNAYSCDATPAE